ncbi:MAG TPA: hypothetical protein VFC37_09545, partial [Terracidiphilus sp.]|nr:hypothetical protein [Terracidiphilus sp.]
MGTTEKRIYPLGFRAWGPIDSALSGHGCRVAGREAARLRAGRAVLFMVFYLSACRGRAGWSFGSLVLTLQSG